MHLGHPAATDQGADLVPPAQQTSCAVHFLPSFMSSWPLVLSLGLSSRPGLDEALAGEATTRGAPLFGVAMFGVGLVCAALFCVAPVGGEAGGMVALARGLMVAAPLP
jgi:hypothetical protein